MDRRAAAGRRTIHHLYVLARGQSHTAGARGRSARALRTFARPAQRRRPPERTMGSELPAPDRELPAGLFSRRLDQHGVESREGSSSEARFTGASGEYGQLADSRRDIAAMHFHGLESYSTAVAQS